MRAAASRAGRNSSGARHDFIRCGARTDAAGARCQGEDWVSGLGSRGLTYQFPRPIQRTLSCPEIGHLLTNPPAVGDHVKNFFEWFGDVSLFGLRAIRDAFRPPFEIDETFAQTYQAGWRSLPLIALSGFAFGVILALQTRAEMEAFGAQAMIPQAVSMGLFTDIGPIIAAMLVAGRVGAGTGAELADMRVSEQIDALEALAVDSFKYLVVTRIVALIIVMPILTTVLNFSGLLGGMVADMWGLHMSWRLFINDAFQPMGWTDYIPPTVKTVVFGFVIGTISCFLGYNAKRGATGVGRASTYSVVLSLLFVILSDVILEKLKLFLFP